MAVEEDAKTITFKKPKRMTDTPDHIKKLQLQIWLSKSPGERLYQAVKDNEDLFAFWNEAKRQMKLQEQNNTPTKP